MGRLESIDYKNLFRKLETTLASVDQSDDTIATLSAILQRIVDNLRTELGVTAGRIYVRHGSFFVLQEEYPRAHELAGFRIPVSYPPLRELLEHGHVFHDVLDPGVDSCIEAQLGVKTFAAIAIGDRRQYLISLSVDSDADSEHLTNALSTIGRVVSLKLRQVRLEDRVAEARQIQLSLLPKSAPTFGDFDVWGASVPAEEVGGDLYDFIPVSERTLGVAIADAAGHGLPAALQARDVIIGLRMGVAESLRITSTIEKLNRVIGSSALASKFISLFYGEVERNGTLVYCNAGHPRPLLVSNGRLEELHLGGLVLGPNPQALYERGYARLEPGAVFLAYTDGISEAENAAGEAFGVERLAEIARRPSTSARALVEAVFAEVRAFSGVEPPRDDQTVVVVLRALSAAART